MRELTDIPVLREWTASQREGKRRISLVPTMGALHEGHLSLVDEAKRHADAVVMSVFINPLQFGPAEDLRHYPRDLDRDRALAQARGVDALFVPTVSAMYPPDAEVRVVPGATASRWEGAQRPGHFTGVLTVVAKLFNLVQPDVAVFGQKDIQQATLIRRMVRDLDIPVEVVTAPTVRETDGLAMSSRNAYLTASQRREAVALNRGLRAADAAWRGGEHDPGRLEMLIRREMLVSPALTIDYIGVVDPSRLDPVARAVTGTIIALAARVGSTRLLDNHILGTEFRLP